MSQEIGVSGRPPCPSLSLVADVAGGGVRRVWVLDEDLSDGADEIDTCLVSEDVDLLSCEGIADLETHAFDI